MYDWIVGSYGGVSKTTHYDISLDNTTVRPTLWPGMAPSLRPDIAAGAPRTTDS